MSVTSCPHCDHMDHVEWQSGLPSSFPSGETLVMEQLNGTIFVAIVLMSPYYSMAHMPLITQNPMLRVAGLASCMLTATSLVNAVVSQLRLRLTRSATWRRRLSMAMLESFTMPYLSPPILIAWSTTFFLVVLTGYVCNVSLPIQQSTTGLGVVEVTILAAVALLALFHSFYTHLTIYRRAREQTYDPDDINDLPISNLEKYRDVM